jgi:hypothetical protein
MTRCKKYKARLSSSHGTKNFLHPVSLSQVSDPYVIVAAKIQWRQRAVFRRAVRAPFGLRLRNFFGAVRI